MKTEDFIEHMKRGEIPPESPDGAFDGYLTYSGDTYNLMARSSVTEMGMWAIVSLDWTGNMADWIETRKCLEVMAGMGWLAKALSIHGINIVATDSKTWTDMHSKNTPVFGVKKMNGLTAVKKYRDAEVLICSWPPYNGNDICKICEEWGPERPIVYIGEGKYGCNAPEEFFEHFTRLDGAPDIVIPQWYGLHDTLEIGTYR